MQTKLIGVMALALMLSPGCGGDDDDVDGGGPGSDAGDPGRDSGFPGRDGGPGSDAGMPPPGVAFEWTDITPGADTQRVYVSSSMGDDAEDCLSEATACQSLQRGEAVLRDGFPDWLLLRRGDTWDESFSEGWSFGWEKSGRSADEPMVVWSYGDGPRPILHAGEEHGFHRHGTEDVHDLAVMGLHFRAHTRDPSSADYVGPAQREFQSGFRWTGGGNVERILVEGCLFEYFGSNLAMHPSADAGPFRDVRIRGNVFWSAWTGNAGNYSQGMYADNIDGLLIEGNVVDHNGGLVAYTDDPQGMVPPGITPRDATVNWFNHQAYIQSGNRNVVVRNNIFANGDGVQLRPGGLAEDNLFTRTIVSLTLGSATTPVAGGITGLVRNNVFLEGEDFAPESDTPGVRAHGVLVANVDAARGLVIEGNLFAHDSSEDRYGRAIGLDGQDCGSGRMYPCPVGNVTISGNIVFDWRGGFRFDGALGTELSAVDVTGNQLINPSSMQDRLLDLGSGWDAAHLTFATNTYDRGGDTQWFRVDGTGYDFDGWVALSGETGATRGASTFSDPTRDLSAYDAQIGGAGTHDSFMTRARAMHRDDWDPRYEAFFANEWIREGYAP